MKQIEIDKPDDFLKLLESKTDEFLYQDHPNDGIDLFCDDELENIGWNAVAFDFITYRSIAEFIEKNCEGTLTFNDHPMGFNGFAIVDNIEDVRKQVKEFIIQQIENNILDEYDDDQLEALALFNLDVNNLLKKQ